jgi:hypothetical protein
MTNYLSFSRMIVEPLDRWDHGRRIWRLVESFHFKLDTDCVTLSIRLPAGFESDGASVPRIFWWLLPHDDTMEGAFLHDALCRDPLLAGHQADALFRLFLRARGHRWWKQVLMYAGVRIGSLCSGRWY